MFPSITLSGIVGRAEGKSGFQNHFLNLGSFRIVLTTSQAAQKEKPHSHLYHIWKLYKYYNNIGYDKSSIYLSHEEGQTTSPASPFITNTPIQFA